MLYDDQMKNTKICSECCEDRSFLTDSFLDGGYDTFCYVLCLYELLRDDQMKIPRSVLNFGEDRSFFD